MTPLSLVSSLFVMQSRKFLREIYLIYISAKAVSKDQCTLAKLMRWVLSQSEPLALLCFQKRAFCHVYFLTLGIALCSLKSGLYDLHTLIVVSWQASFSLFHQKIMEQKALLWKRTHSIPLWLHYCVLLYDHTEVPSFFLYFLFFVKGTNYLILSC